MGSRGGGGERSLLIGRSSALVVVLPSGGELAQRLHLTIHFGAMMLLELAPDLLGHGRRRERLVAYEQGLQCHGAGAARFATRRPFPGLQLSPALLAFQPLALLASGFALRLALFFCRTTSRLAHGSPGDDPIVLTTVVGGGPVDQSTVRLDALVSYFPRAHEPGDHPAN